MSDGWPAISRRRPVGASRRLGAGSEACPLSLRDLLQATAPGRIPLPIFLAPLPAVARAVLLAGRRAGCALGLSAGAVDSPEAWFGEVAAAAGEVAPRLPFFVSAAVEVGPGKGEVERATALAARLVEAGATHLAVDVSRLPEQERIAAAAAVSRCAGERDLAVELLFAGADALPTPGQAGAMLGGLSQTRFPPDALGVMPGAAEGVEAVRTQARALASLAAALGPIWLVRRGPVSPILLRVCRAVGLAAVEDGGAVLAAALEELLPDARAALLRAHGSRSFGAVPGPLGERIEAVSFAEAAAFIEALGAAGSARLVEETLAPRETG